MGEQDHWTLDHAVQSYAHWWREAGFHTATDPVAHGWRAPAAPFWQREAAPPAQTPPSQDQRAAAQAVAAAVAPAPALLGRMPECLPAFLDWLTQDAGQPEAGWDGALILPPAQLAGKLVVIVDMPAMQAADGDTLIDAAQRRFIMAMLASLGLATDESAIVSLAARRPPGGLLDGATLGRLAARMTHYLGLAGPRGAIVLGDRTSRALIGAQWAPGADRLQKINHGSLILETVALAAPELLMSRPAAKARSWQALRMLHGMMNA